MAQATFSVRMDETLKRQLEKNFPQGLSFDEINEEIRKTRYGEEDIE